ncbi:MAG: DinB family protein [Chloroflexi bacterium]|nr:DinB family protein [Chloroflexota bacterium]
MSEAWLSGPVEGVPVPLQPVAHALLQAREEVAALVSGFAEERLWDRPHGVASVGFHLQHLTGVLDRLFTYARGEALSATQLEALAGEGKPRERGSRVDELLSAFDQQVERALAQLRSTEAQSLAESRLVGRKQLPSTVLGLLAHAAEHVQRHVGQLLVTVRVQREERPARAERC